MAWVLTRAEDWCGECSSSAEASNNEKPVESTNPPHQVSQQDQKRLISERDAAKYIGMSRSYLAKGRMEGALPGRTPPPPFVRIGRAIRYDIADLDSWLEKHKYGL